jgi:hypothetical protein
MTLGIMFLVLSSESDYSATKTFDDKRIQRYNWWATKAVKTKLTNWFSYNKKWNTMQYTKKHVYDCLKELPLRNEEKLIFLLADLKAVREVKALKAQGT